MIKDILFLLAIVLTITCSFALAEVNTNGLTPTVVTGKLIYLNPGVPYNKNMLTVHTSSNYYLLTGKTNGMEKVIGKMVEIHGFRYVGPQGFQFYKVISYQLI